MKKYFMIMMSVLLVVDFSGFALADPVADPPGDNAGYGPIDLLVAEAEVYDRGDTDLLKLSIETVPNLPGIVIFECDVDNSTGTGGNLGMTGIPVAPCPCKTVKGMDINILLAVRQQGDGSQTAFCESCVDAQPPNASCAKGRRSGEWYAGATALGTGDSLGILRGLLDPLPKPAGGAGTEDCYTFPWGQILAYAHVDLQGNPKKFNWAKSQDPANNKWQVSVWHDAVFADEDDLSDGVLGPFNISDWLPNGDGNKADMQVSAGATDRTYCEGNLDGDADVDGGDAAKFKGNFGRSKFSNPCPPCGPHY